MKISKFIYLMTALLAFPFLNSCSSGGRGYTRANICEPNDDFYDADKITLGKKISVQPGSKFTESNNYKIAGAGVYLYDETRNIKIHIQQTVSEKGEIKASVGCLSGFSLSSSKKPFSVDIPFITEMSGDGSGSASTNKGETGTQYKFQFLKLAVDPNSKTSALSIRVDKNIVAAEGSPFDIYSNFLSSDHSFFTSTSNQKIHNLVSTLETQNIGKDNDMSFEIRVFVDLRTE